ncbi:MAG: hybrid sensor histidine kinase/response regulator [Chloroflexi bacterium]|nr:hybrid sensor histidine kinase/response regulator [Chloroflexota bacterium]
MAPLILVIDDNPDITQIVSVILRAQGYETIVAGGGPEALTLLEGRRPDLILCDILMPEMDGFEVFRRVRSNRRWRAIPFVFLTALTDEKTRMSSSELGAEAFITKPFSRHELLAIVAGVLRRAQELQTDTEEEFDSFKAQLLFMITHELNTPLSVIRMLTDSMRSNLDQFSPERTTEYVDLMAQSVWELSHVVESMLLALQIDSGRAQKAFETWAGPKPLRAVLDVVITKATAKATARNVALHKVAFDAPLWVKGHEEQLQQIFGRILDNAINFSPAGEIVEIAMWRDGARAGVSIRDRGPGLTADEIKTAFERLRQVNRAQQEQQGVGLSLNLVRSLVTIHGGEITMESTPGHGTTVTIALPLTEPPVEPKRNRHRQ